MARTAPPINPASINIEKKRLLLFEPSNAIGIIDKVVLRLYSASYKKYDIIYVGRLVPNASNPASIPAGAEEELSQISTPGTGAQTKIVRRISQTAVIFSTIDSIHFYLAI